MAVSSDSPWLCGRERRQTHTAGAVRTPLCAGGPCGSSELCVVKEHTRVHDVDGSPHPGQVAIVVLGVGSDGLRNTWRGTRPCDSGLAILQAATGTGTGKSTAVVAAPQPEDSTAGPYLATA